MTTIATFTVLIVSLAISEIAWRRGRTSFERWGGRAAGFAMIVAWMLVVEPDMAPFTWLLWSGAFIGTQVVTQMAVPARPRAS